MSGLRIDLETWEEIFKELDTNGDGQVTQSVHDQLSE